MAYAAALTVQIAGSAHTHLADRRINTNPMVAVSVSIAGSPRPPTPTGPWLVWHVSSGRSMYFAGIWGLRTSTGDTFGTRAHRNGVVDVNRRFSCPTRHFPKVRGYVRPQAEVYT